MPGPHQDNGVPWSPKPPTTPPVSTGTPNFGPPGTGGANQPPPPPVTPPVSTGTPNFGGQGTGGANQPPPVTIIDDTLDDSWESQINPYDLPGGDFEEPYTPPEEIYPWLEGGLPTENWVNVSQVGGGPNSPGSALYGIDLASYGFDPKAEFLPQDFLQSIMEGSWVSGNEAVQNASLAPNITDPNDPNFNLSDFEAAVDAGWEANIGTWGDVEAGTHPLFPGGLDDYYNMQSSGWGVTNPGTGGEAWQDYGYYDPRQATFDKLRFLQAGLPQKGMEQSGFFGEMTDPYAGDVSEALNKGIFSGAMGQGVFDPKGLRRLITSFGSGVTKPRYANVARGGIISLVGE
jgi:hypothetical protein